MTISSIDYGNTSREREKERKKINAKLNTMFYS